jgi:hypothetical protein
MSSLQHFSRHPFTNLRSVNQVESNAFSLGTNDPVSNHAEIPNVDSPTNWGGG